MICNEVKATGGTKIGYYILFRKYRSRGRYERSIRRIEKELVEEILD